MSIKRPAHLTRRQIAGRAFSEGVVLIRLTGGGRNKFGEWQATETPADTVCATAPASGDDARVRELMEDGVHLEAMRIFWTVEALNPAVEGSSPGDILVFESERWRVRSTKRWGGFSESLAVRQSPQTQR